MAPNWWSCIPSKWARSLMQDYMGLCFSAGSWFLLSLLLSPAISFTLLSAPESPLSGFAYVSKSLWFHNSNIMACKLQHDSGCCFTCCPSYKPTDCCEVARQTAVAQCFRLVCRYWGVNTPKEWEGGTTRSFYKFGSGRVIRNTQQMDFPVLQSGVIEELLCN